MVHYYGIEALLKRLGLKSYTGLRSQIALEAIPIFRRFCRVGRMKLPRHVLYSNELLLMTWELEQVRKLREELIALREVHIARRSVAHRAGKARLLLPIRQVA